MEKTKCEINRFSEMKERNLLLRNYQIKLIQEARTQNSIIFLPTGSGKTLIAIHVLFSKSQEINKPYCSGKRAFFVACTKIMVVQLATTLLSQTKFNVGYYTGDMNVDSWNKEIWISQFEMHHVIVLTAEILKRILALKFIDHTKISLIVLDECHHAVGNHPYNGIMNAFSELDETEMPLILGLTACLLYSSPKGSEYKEVENLEKSLRSKIISLSDIDDVIRVSANPKDIVANYHQYDSSIIETVLKIYSDAIDNFTETFLPVTKLKIESAEIAMNELNKSSTRHIKKYLVHARDHLLHLGAFCGSIAALYYIIHFEKLRLLSDDPFEMQAFVYATTALNKVRRLLARIMGEKEDSASIYRYSSPKVQRLIELICSNFRGSEGPNQSAIVFVHQRATAIILSLMMKRLVDLDERFHLVKTDFVISWAVTNNSYFSSVQFKKEEIMQRFSTGELNLIFATNILEEGIDIVCCNIVVSFDFPLTYSSYVQSRGRARSQNSKYYIFVKSFDEEKKKSLFRYINLESELRKVINTEELNNSNDGDGDSSELVEEISLSRSGKKVKLDGSMAIQIVTKYCCQLPQDFFSYMSFLIWYQSSGSGKKAFLRLPINSPIKEDIEGDFQRNVKLAKKSVCLKTVKLLYELKELDDDFNIQQVDIESEDYKELFPHFQAEKSKSGSRVRPVNQKRLYQTQFSNFLKNCLPLPDRITYLHLINFNVAFDGSDLLERHQVVRESLIDPCTYGIITSKKLPTICRFPLFLKMGRIDCDFIANYDEIVFNSSELGDIKLFHFTVFKKVLNILQDYQIYDNRNEENSFFIVPLQPSTDKYVLDWNLIKCDFCKISATALVNYNPSSENVRKNYSDRTHSNVASRGNSFASKSLVPLGVFDGRQIWACNQEEDKSKRRFIMTETNYSNFVISPNYRGFPQYYVVSSFCHSLSPLSSFPNKDHENYLDYYKVKYGIEIVNKEQPLLKVSPLPSCSNFNKPHVDEEGRGRRFRNKDKGQQELLVPELCNVYPFSKNFWIKAILLPTLINRISNVYRAEELRQKIVQETGLGILEIPENRSWADLLVTANKIKFDEAEEDAEKNFGRGTNRFNSQLKSNLPLTQLKSKIYENQLETVVDPFRNMFEFGLCDLENFIEISKKSDFDAYAMQIDALRSNSKKKKFILEESTKVPELKLLKISAGNELGAELARIVQMPAATVKAGTKRLEKMFSVLLRDVITQKACTSKSANDMMDYERLEILGDSFLKFASSLFLFKNFSSTKEGKLSTIKGKLVGNKNLFDCANAKNLVKFINAKDFSPSSDWNPPLFCVPEELVKEITLRKMDSAIVSRFDIPKREQISGEISRETVEKNKKILMDFCDGNESSDELLTNSLISHELISDKTIADVVEALMGTYLLELGLQGGFDILNWLGILPEKNGSFYEVMKVPFDQKLVNFISHNQVITALNEKMYSDLEAMLGYEFKHKGLLLEALTHPSYNSSRNSLCYQRLEFLGDAILDFLITAYLYENVKDLTPGQLTDVRSALVNNITFACLTVRYDFHKYMFSESSCLTSCIDKFVKLQISRNHAVEENVLISLNEEDCLVAETVKVPKALGDLFESLAGAIFLDSENSLETVWRIYYKLMKREIEEFTQNVPKSAVRRLYEICGGKPHFESTVNEKGVSVVCTVLFNEHEIVSCGFGENKKEAKQSASRLALNEILKIKN